MSLQIGMQAYHLTHAEALVLTEMAVEMGASAPTDEYLADHEGCTFLAVPVCHTTATEFLMGLTAYDAELGSAVPEREKLPDNLTVEKFFEVLDGKRRTIGRAHGQVAVVFLEAPKNVEPTLAKLPQPLPLRVGYWYQREGLLYLAHQLDPCQAQQNLFAEAKRLGRKIEKLR